MMLPSAEPEDPNAALRYSRPRRPPSRRRPRADASVSRSKAIFFVAILYSVATLNWSVEYEEQLLFIPELAESLAQSRYLKVEATNDAPLLTVFYAIEAIKTEDGGAETFPVVTVDGQLQVIRNSPSLDNVEIRYRTYGNSPMDRENMEELCSSQRGSQDTGMTCVSLGHRRFPFSDQPMMNNIYDYCVENTTHSVVYLRSSESPYPWAGNVSIIQSTEAALSEECIRPPHNDTCAVCGRHFRPLPFPSFSGNIWTAKCSYVKELIDPTTFEQKIQEVIEEESRLIDMELLNFSLFDKAVSLAYGPRDVRWHQYITIHPTFRPCQTGMPRDGGGVALAPRNKFSSWLENTFPPIKLSKDSRQREYSLLAGLLVRLFILYEAPPDEFSWAWEWYPDAAFWRDAVDEHGTFAVEETIPKPKKYSDHALTDYAVFYHVYVGLEPSFADAALSIVEDQLSQIAQSFAGRSGAKVYITTVGGMLHYSWVQTLCRSLNLKCQFLKHYPEAHEDRTLQEVNNFCDEQKDANIIYLHSKGSFHPESMGRGYIGQDNWRRAMTSAITGEPCLGALESTCDVCGLLFQPIPQPHWPGNMWTSSCKYIRKLPAPDEMMAKRRESIAKLTEMIKGSYPIEANFCPFIPMTYGLDRYFAEHWVGAHPSMRACDVSSKVSLSYWKEQGRNESEFQVHVAPRYPINTSWDFYNYCEQHDVLEQKYDRLREYFLLPGQLKRMLLEFDSIPEDDWWGWGWYPDGSLWKGLLKTHKDLAFEEARRLYASELEILERSD